MGQATGKLVIPHTTASKAKTVTENELNGTETHENVQPAPMDKGEVKGHADTDQAANGPNGTVNGPGEEAAEEKKEKSSKKTKNPIVWIQRRLSKRNSTSRKETVDDAADSQHVEHVDEHPADGSVSSHPTNDAKADKEVKQVAEALVDEAISSAVTSENERIHQKEPEETAPPTTETAELKVPDPVIPEPHVETVGENGAPVEETKRNEAEEVVNDHLNGTAEINDSPIVDTNNTNAEDGYSDGKIITEEQDDIVAKKLANLEPSNGHVERDGVLINGDSTF
jgi:hypothetical protein